MKSVKFETYDDYVRTQQQANERKLPFVWVSARELEAVAGYIRKQIPGASLGLCHGVRTGYEVRKLRSLLNCRVVGTELADTAERLADVIRWDFHETKAEWIGSIDFIYSNSWDHSYEPDRMLSNWMRCLTPNGRCFLEWTPWHSDAHVRGADCFGGSLEEIVAWINEAYEVEAVLEMSERVGGGVRLFNLLRWMVVDRFRSREIRLIVIRPRRKDHAPAGS